MHVLRHEEFSSGCDAQWYLFKSVSFDHSNGAYARPWSKTMVGYGAENENFVFELTFNYGITGYPRGNDFKHAVVNVKDAGSVLKEAKEKGFVVEDGAIRSPDGYLFVVVEMADVKSPFVLGVAINVTSLEKSLEYYEKVVKLSVLEKSNQSAKLGFETFPNLELVQLNQGESLNHAKAYGRIAIAVDDETLKQRETEISKSGYKIHTPYVSLDTPGKATVQVVILQDIDDHEICLVGKKGFFDLCKPFEGCDQIDFAQRKFNGSKEE